MAPRNDSCFVAIRFGDLSPGQGSENGATRGACQVNEDERTRSELPALTQPGSPVRVADASDSETRVAQAPGSDAHASGLRRPVAKTFAEIEASGPPETQWLWHGYLAARCATLVTGLWRSGKTTLLSVLLSRLGAGGMLAGRSVAPGKAVVLSEEDESIWRRRGQTLNLRPHVKWYCKPFLGKPSLEDWQWLLDQIAIEHEREKIDLLVIDGLAKLSPMRSENETGEMLKTLQPLDALTARGMSVWISHHPSKGRARRGAAGGGRGGVL